MKRKLIISAMFGAVLLSALPALAITPQQFNCEKAVLTELGKMSAARGKCITKCVGKKQTHPADFTCSPPFDGSTNLCATNSETKYIDQIVAKCTGQMPLCGGFERGVCDNNTSQACDCDLGTSCNLSCGLGSCDPGFCSVTTSQTCSNDDACPIGETCVHSGVSKDPARFARGNIYDGAPSIVAQIDLFAEGLFLCRQKVCSDTGDLCSSDGDCAGGTCNAGDCATGGADCDFDGQCAVAPKKCLARGRCSVTAQACNLGVVSPAPGSCPGVETCLRYGRCTDAGSPPGTQSICFTDGECSLGETCVRSATQTNRKKELLCTQAVNGALSKLTFDIFNCEAACGLERDLKDGGRCQGDLTIKCKLPPNADTCRGNGPCQPTSCDHFAIGRCSGGEPFDNQVCSDDSDCPPANQPCVATLPAAPASPTLLACRAKAFALAKKTIGKKCLAFGATPAAPVASLPACGVYSQFGSPVGFQYTADNLTDFVSNAQDGQFKEDNPDLSPGRNLCLP